MAPRDENERTIMPSSVGDDRMGLLASCASEVARGGSMESFHECMSRHGLNLYEELAVIRLVPHYRVAVTFLSQLLDYADKVAQQLCRLEDLPNFGAVPLADTSQPSAVMGDDAAVEEPQRAFLPTFMLTEEGGTYSHDQWKCFVVGAAKLLRVPEEQLPDLSALLGVAQRYARKGFTLERRVTVGCSKKLLVHLIALMYGTLRYHLVVDQVVSGVVFRAGMYGCCGLIRVPDGHGADAQCRTTDNYWQLLDSSIILRQGAAKANTSATRRSHSYTTALKPPLDPVTAAPILALLKPLGLQMM